MKRLADQMLDRLDEDATSKHRMLVQRLYIYEKISIALQRSNAQMIRLCGNPHLAQRELNNPSADLPLVDLTFVEWRGLR